MRLFITIAVSLLLLASCVSMRNQPYTGFHIITKPGNEIVYDCDRYEILEFDDKTPYAVFKCGTYTFPEQRAFLVTTRSNQPTPVTIKNDTAQRTVYIKPHLAFWYYANILNLGIGFIKDSKHPYRFTYPRKVVIDMRDTGNYYTYYKQPRKGNVTILLSPPLVNVYNLSLDKKVEAATPIFGTTLGLGYWYHPKRFVTITGGAVSASKPLCPDGCGIIDTAYQEGRKQTAWFISLQHHHLLHRFDIGYGIHGGSRKWEKQIVYSKSVRPVIEEATQVGLGPAFSARFQAGSFIHIGFDYQPYLFQVHSDHPGGYSHIINIGAQFRLTPRFRSRW